MIYSTIHFNNLNVKASYSLFRKKDQVAECHASLELTNHQLAPAHEQYEHLELAVSQLFSPESELSGIIPVWRRYFVSDAINQSQFIPQKEHEAISIVQQSPLNRTKVALWIYGMESVQSVKISGGGLLVKRPAYSHLFHTQLHSQNGDTFEQTTDIFGQYIKSLADFNATLAANCVRTWLFMQNVDTHYAAMVDARKNVFDQENLTSETHYIASTGIEGKYIHQAVTSFMDAYAIPEVKKGQVTFLKGEGYLNPTHEYGVTFERGTAVQYGDRRQVYISGTASINNKGEILYPHDIVKQTARALKNIHVLLHEADCAMDDVAHLLIYLRDMADYTVVDDYLAKHYPDIPRVILLAPVCRPGWLVEMECIAIKAIADSRFDNY